MTASRGALLCAAIAAVLLGCNAPTPTTTREFNVGNHRVKAAVPQGWDALDLGAQVAFRKELANVVMQDLGPAGRPGIRREVERAQELWRAGREEDARWRMRNVNVPNALFDTRAEREAFWAAWNSLSGFKKGTGYAEVESAFEDIVEKVDAMPTRDLASLADASLATLDHDRRREVKSRKRMTVGGREALLVETWDRTSHEQPKRLAFIANDDYLLSLRTDLGPYDETSKTFDSVLATLQFEGALPERR